MASSFGLIGKKCGMTSLFTEDGNILPCTVIYIDRHYVAGVKTVEKNGYNAVVIGVHEKREKLINKPQEVQLKKNNLPMLSDLKEFRLPDDINMSEIKIGSEFEINFQEISDSFVDIRSISKGKGFAGVVKRYGFAGQLASHGDSVSHRSHGSTGQRQDPGKVFKGKKMAGHMGATMNCIQSLSIVKSIPEERMIFVAGSVSGFSGANVVLTNAIKKSEPINSKLGFVFNWVKLSCLNA